MDEKNVIRLIVNNEEKSFAFEDFSDEQKKLCLHVQELQKKMNHLKFDLDQLQPSFDFYLGELIKSVSQEDKKVG